MVRWRVWKRLLNLLIRLFGTSAVKSKRATVSPFEHVVSSWLGARSLRNFFSLIALGAVLSVAATSCSGSGLVQDSDVKVNLTFPVKSF